MPGCGALVLTVDTPVGSKRERNIRNGFANIRGGLFQALSLKPSILIEAMTHPGWIVEYFKRGGGTPMLENWQPYAPAGVGCRGGRINSPRRCGRSTRRPGAISRPTASCSRAPWSSRASWIRRDALRADRCRLRRHPGVEPRRSPARPGAGFARRVAGDQGGGRRQADPAARQRRAARRRHPDRAVSRRRFLLHGPADALWRGGGRDPRGQEGDRHFPGRDRSRHGPDRLPSLDQLGPDFLWREDWARNV